MLFQLLQHIVQKTEGGLNRTVLDKINKALNVHLQKMKAKEKAKENWVLLRCNNKLCNTRVQKYRSVFQMTRLDSQ